MCMLFLISEYFLYGCFLFGSDAILYLNLFKTLMQIFKYKIASLPNVNGQFLYYVTNEQIAMSNYGVIKKQH